MKSMRFKLGKQARLLACLAVFSATHIYADEPTSKPESNSATKASEKDNPKSQSEEATVEEQKNTEKTNDSTTRFQMQFQQLNSGLPQIHIQGGPGVAVTTFPNGLGFNGEVNSFNQLGPAQKKKLRNAVSEALEQSGISSEAIEKSLEKIDKALDEFSMHSKMQFGNQKPPYRIGVGCRQNEAGETSPGLEIESVFDDSPAASAGLKVGDRLISVDDKAIESLDDIVSAVQMAGEESRSVQLKATRDGVESVYEIKPSQAAIAEMNPGMNFSGMPGMLPGQLPGMFPGQAQAWVMPQFPPNFDPKIQEQIRDAMNAARNSMQKGSRGKEVSPESQNEKNIDKLRDEFSSLRKDLDEIKEMLKKLSDKL